MMLKPSMLNWEPICCPACLAILAVRRLWVTPGSLVLVCEFHGETMTEEYFDAVIRGRVES